MKQTNLKQTEIGKIPEDWEVDVLSKHIHIIGGGTPKTSVEEYWNGDIPWVSVVDFVGDKRWINDTEKHITQKGLEESSTKLLQDGEIIISARGTVGELGQVTKNMAFNQSCYGLTGTDKILNDFLYYSLIYNIKDVKSKTHGSVFNTITKTTFDQITISVPPLPEQRAIAKILSDLDSKIELLQKQNQTLEEIGQAIFKHWFIDFEFPDENGNPYKSSGGEMVYSEELGKEIPKGWEVKPLDKIAEFLNGLPLQKYHPKDEKNWLNVIKIRELRQGITESCDKCSDDIPEKYIVNNGDVLFSWSGSLETVLWTDGKGALNQHLFKVMSQHYPKWLYYYWIKQHLKEFRSIAESKVTTMGHIQRHHLKEALVVVPPSYCLKSMDDIMRNILQKTINAKVESNTLSNIRDSLLPKLMSGKIRVPVGEDE